MSYYLPPYIKQDARVMVFVDGENLAIRYGKILGDQKPQKHITFEPNVFVWSKFANIEHHRNCDVIRKYYYTSIKGDTDKLIEIEEKLKTAGIEAPRVFKKNKGKGSKQVDISLATDMLTHAHRNNYDIAILVAGDEDYVPLVEAVTNEGKRVVLWFFEKDLSPLLKRKVDFYFDISIFLLNDSDYLTKHFW
jgi:uncharacterized LabA/DUF88 family protein